MKSLRSRLILAFSLVAVIPLAIAMALLGGRVQQVVTAQAGDRLGDALSAAESQLRVDGERMADRIERMAGSAELRDLVLARDGTAIRAFLAANRERLALDDLALRDSGGWTRADSAGVDADESTHGAGVALVPLSRGRGFALVASAPVGDRRAPLAILRGALVLDSLRLVRLAEASGVDLVLGSGRGAGLVSTIVGGPEAAANGAEGRVEFDGRSYIVRHATITIGKATPARLTGFVSTAAIDQTLNTLWIAALVLALLGIALAVVLGTVWSRQVSRPVEQLAEFSERISRGEWDQPLALESVREIDTLVAALERMRGDLHVYRERLGAGERQAAYGQMARKVAHEIKNPLTPIAVSIADLRRSYELQRPEFPQILDQAVRVIGEEIQALQRLIQEFSDFGRFPAPEIARFEVAGLFEELATLYAVPVQEGRLRFDAASAPAAHADRAQLRQALINLIQNGLDATSGGGRVTVNARSVDESLEIEVSDDGPGLTAEQASRLFVPGFTTKQHGSGLGLTIVERIVSDHGGTVAARSAHGRGTTFRILLPRPRGI